MNQRSKIFDLIDKLHYDEALDRITKKNDINKISDEYGKPLALWVVEKSHVSESFIIELLDRGLNFNVRYEGYWAIQHAIAMRSARLVDHLLKHKTKLNGGKKLFELAAHWRVNIDNLVNVMEVLNQNSYRFSDEMASIFLLDLSSKVTSTSQTRKFHIIEPFLDYLITCGANVNYQKATGDKLTPLMYSSFNYHFPMVKYLVAHGADINMQSKNGYTALMFVSGQIFTSYGFTPSDANNEILSYLIDNGADPSIKDNGKRTALSYARRSNNTKAIERLSAVNET